jgi:hypothetical protein
MEISFACSVHVNTCSVRYPLTSFTPCKPTTKLSTVSHNVSPVTSLTASISAWNFVWIDAVYTIFELAPKEINSGIHVRWTWWPGWRTLEALWKSIPQDMATNNITQDVEDDISCVWAHTLCWKNFVSIRSAPSPAQWVPGALSLGVKAAGEWSWPLTSI